MTSQTQKFVEPSDIVSLKLECKSCGSTLAIPSSRDMKSRENAGKLSFCPICGAVWSNLSGATYEPLVSQFVAALNKLREALAEAPIGFNLTFEVTEDDSATEEKSGKTTSGSNERRKARF